MQETDPEQLELGSDELHQLNGMTISNSVLNFNTLKMEVEVCLILHINALELCFYCKAILA